MLRKRTILFIPILIVIVAGFLFLRPAPKSPPASVSPDDSGAIDPVRAAEIAAIIEQYPMLDKANREERLKQPVSSRTYPHFFLNACVVVFIGLQCCHVSSSAVRKFISLKQVLSVNKSNASCVHTSRIIRLMTLITE